METVAVLSGYFHFGNNHDLISFLLELFGFSELLTIFKMENSRAVIAKFATTEDKSGVPIFLLNKQLNELVGIADRLLFPNSLNDRCNFCNSHFFSCFHFGKNSCTKSRIAIFQFNNSFRYRIILIFA